jgi:hypothetical protein
MTIALAIKVHDGLVLAADSATTLMDGSNSVANIYNNANKVFNLHKGLPIGALTWGLGNIGPASISTLAKDVRRRFTSSSESHWKVDPENYDVATVADRVHEFMFTERYEPLFGNVPADDRPFLGFLTAGYSSDDDSPRLFEHSLDGQGGAVREVLTAEAGAQWWGQPEAIARILNGLTIDLVPALVNMGIEQDVSQALVTGAMGQVARPLVSSAMPIQDAIDLAEFLVATTIQFVRFSPGHATVGGPIDIATITKHEGLKWIQRKHFYDQRFNPTKDAL